MGDRNNPIKFGPEWLRNLASEGHPSTSGGNNHTPMPHNSASGAGASGGGASGNTASSPSSSNASNMSPKVQLAKLRYGREEMLALYDRTSEAPPELKYIDLLYQTRGKPPFALNTFDDEMRDFARGGPPIGSMSPGERFGMSRGSPRGLSLSDTKPRLRAPFVRQPFAGRGPLWHVASPRMPGYSGGADDDSSNSRSSWSASNGGNHQNRNSGEQVEWTPNKQYRRRQGHANWRQAREEGEEWRSPDAGRSRPNQQDKWERDWGGPSQDRQSWNSNRRNWVGGDQNNEENLPEWAMENAEACGGTFDSSGAFHGYSNDDTNIPKSQDSSYPLTRSHTHGSFARSRTVEEGSEDWWASDKAKKLSPKRFDASDVKFRKQMSTPEVSAEGGIEVKPCLRKEIDKRHEVPEKESAAYEENASGGFSDDEKYVKSNAFKQNFTDSKTFEALMRSDINLEEGTDDRGNFQSVMINPNNSLRQKHQHMVPVASEMTRENMNMTNAGILHLLQNAPTSTSLENEMRKKQQQSSEDKIVEEIFDMTLDDKELLQKGKPISSPMMNHSITMCSTMASMANSMPQISSSGMQMRLSSQGYQGIPVNSKPNMPQGAHGLPVGLPSLPVGLQGGIQSGMQTMSSGYPIGLPPSIHQITGMQPMLQGGMQSAPIPGGMQPSGMQVSVNQQSVMSGSGIQTSAMQGNNMQQPQMQGGMQGPGIQGPGMQGPALSPGVQGGIPPSGMQQGGMPIQGMHGNMPPSLQGITNSALNASLGLPIGPSSNAMGVPRMGGPGLQGVMGAGGIQGNGAGMPSYPSGGLAAISSNNSLFMGQNSSNSSMGSTTDIPMPNHGSQSNMFSMNSLQHSSSQAAFNSMYSNLPPPNNPALADQWYYEDPEKNIQGPFTSKEMYNWYRAGFFGPNLLVRRACDAAMRPLGSYGPMVPFTPFTHMDLMGSYPLTSGFDRSPGAHEMLNSQKGLCLDPVMNIPPPINDAPTMDSIQFGSVGLIRNPPFAPPPPMVDSLWSQPTADMVWMQQALGQRQHNEARVNNLPLFFWEQQPSAITSNALLPEEIAKEMKTEDQILAQLRASQNISTPQSAPFANEPPTVTAAPTKSEETTPSPPNATPNMEELQKLIQKDTLVKSASETSSEPTETQPKPEKPVIKNDSPPDVKRPTQTKGTGDAKPSKQSKNENEKPTKNKENNSGKNKNKKKEEKKVETENKPKEEENVKIEKRSEEPSPPKTKKDDKQNKKDTEKEKKEWIRDGFTIVKGSEKGPGKDKKKVEEAKAVEEAERKRKDEERLAAEEEKKKKQTEQAKKQQQQQQQKQAPEAERVVKKAPWSAMNNQGMTASNKDGLSLTEIQRLEREKKLEMMKEQQQMMQLIAQQQAAALAREQEMQAGLGWAKKKTVNVPVPGQSLAEIQAEARKQAAAAVAAATAAAAAQAIEESAQPPTNTVAWSNATNGGGFWDPQPQVAEKPQELPKPAVEREVKAKKKPAVVAAAAPAKKEPSPSAKKEPSPPAKKDSTPAIEFEGWCTSVLAPWSTKIDVPTFVGFLKDIESPYEVKDYAKCYLGDSKESNDFARQFLERRSKMLRVGMVTPSDDLCSPAMAVNPRTTSGSDYQEVKGKGKKTKKNKMLKVDARILGFSVTASEDRINVGDIDTV